MTAQTLTRRETLPHALLKPTSDVYQFTPQQIAIKEQIAQGATPGEYYVFLTTAQRSGLDPLARQIYCIPRWNPKEKRETWQTQVSIDGQRVIAERTGQYEGQVGPQWCGSDGQWRDIWTDAKPPAAARVGVLKTGFREPLWGIAMYRDYVVTNKDGQPTSRWSQAPAPQLAKCAESQALRRAFPHDLSGLYTSDEMERVAEEERRARSGAEATHPRTDAAASASAQQAPTSLLDFHKWARKKLADAGHSLTPDLAARILHREVTEEEINDFGRFSRAECKRFYVYATQNLISPPDDPASTPPTESPADVIEGQFTVDPAAEGKH